MIGSSPDPHWHRSSRCGNGHCIEIARVGDHYLIRDSKNPQVAPLDFTTEEWESFVAAVKADEFSF